MTSTRPGPASLTDSPPGDAIAGSLLGTAIGDAIALPYEGLSRRRVQKFWPGGRLRHRLLAGYGFCSDDTEHSCMVAQALLAAAAKADPDADAERFVAAFRRDFAWRLRWWLCGLPAGIGLATLRSIVKLWLNPFGSGRGVYSAGNAPAMRSAIIGAALGSRLELMRRIVGAATQLTHTDPRAEHGALAIALAAAIAAERRDTPAGRDFPEAFDAFVGAAGDELSTAIRRARDSVARGESSDQFAASIGCAKGVSGYVMHSVPVALHVWFRHEGNYADAIEAVVRCGGDTDTVAAIVGGIIGAGVGAEGIPEAWQADLAEWPRSRHWITALAGRLAARFCRGEPQPPLPLNLPLLMLRNAAFMVVVLGHGFRRLLPPY